MKIIKFIFLIFVIVFIYLFEQIQSERMLYEIQSLQEQLNIIKKDCVRLESIYNKFISSTNLDVMAKNLNLSLPDSDRIIEIYYE